jgi:hypothetical protein
MSRFDPTFNEIDPITQRAFSGGHPDGVWIVSILLGVPAFLGLLGGFGAIFMLLFGKFALALRLIIGALVLLGLYAPPIVLLFHRRVTAIYWMIGLLALDLLVIFAALGLPPENPSRGQLLALGMFGLIMRIFMVYYLFRLKQHELLT